MQTRHKYIKSRHTPGSACADWPGSETANGWLLTQGAKAVNRKGRARGFRPALLDLGVEDHFFVRLELVRWGCGDGASAADIRLLAGHWIDLACDHAEELMILAQQLADLVAELLADRAREQ